MLCRSLHLSHATGHSERLTALHVSVAWASDRGMTRATGEKTRQRQGREESVKGREQA